MERMPVNVPLQICKFNDGGGISGVNLKTTENLSRKVVKIIKKDVIRRDRKEKCSRGPQPL